MKKETHVLTVDLDWIQNQRQGLELIKFLKPLVESTETIFIRGHQQAYDLVEPESHLYNIDHHHDMAYGTEDKAYRNAIEKGIFCEGEWVLAAVKHKKLKSYTWIKNYNSSLIYANVSQPIRALAIFRMFDELKDFEKTMPKFKRIIICESLDYEPETPFYYALFKCLAKNYKEVINDNFKSYRQIKN